MKTRILDEKALRAISPSALAAYARGEGWRKVETYGAHADVYEAHDKPEIILPRTDHLGDYPTVVSKLIAIFSMTAGGDELSIYRNLIGADSDILRVRSILNGDDGSVPIDAGVEIVFQARQMLLAAACAAQAPQPLFRAGANREASDYLRRVRLGQTEHGSFIVTLLAPVPPLLQPRLDLEETAFDDEPFERQVTLRLTHALEASRNAVERATAGEGGDAFDSAVREGVSANLCEAVAGLIDQACGLEISLTWARTRPRHQVRHTVAFTANDAEVLKEAARTFRARHPKPDVTLYGNVYRLTRGHEAVEGLVTLKALVDGHLRSVHTVLDQANYGVAVQAHKEKWPVLVNGDLERIGQRWRLTNARITATLPATDEDDDNLTP